MRFNLVATMLFVGALTATSSPALAQGMFLEKGTSGYGFDLGLATGNDVTGIGGGIGYSHNGVLDLRLSINRYDLGLDLSGLELAPSIRVHAIKQSEDAPMSLAFDASYSRLGFSSDVLDEVGWEMRQTGFVVGSAVYGALAISDKTSFIPELRVSYGSYEMTIEDSFGDSISDDADGVLFTIAGTLNAPAGVQNRLGLRASLSFDEDSNTSFGLGLSTVIPNVSSD